MMSTYYEKHICFTVLTDVQEIEGKNAFADYVTDTRRKEASNNTGITSATTDHSPTIIWRVGTANHTHPNNCITIETVKKTRANTEANQSQVATDRTYKFFLFCL